MNAQSNDPERRFCLRCDDPTPHRLCQVYVNLAVFRCLWCGAIQVVAIDVNSEHLPASQDPPTMRQVG